MKRICFIQILLLFLCLSWNACNKDNNGSSQDYAPTYLDNVCLHFSMSDRGEGHDFTQIEFYVSDEIDAIKEGNNPKIACKGSSYFSYYTLDQNNACLEIEYENDAYAIEYWEVTLKFTDESFGTFVGVHEYEFGNGEGGEEEIEVSFFLTDYEKEENVEISLSVPNVYDVTKNSAKIWGEASGDLDKASDFGVYYDVVDRAKTKGSACFVPMNLVSSTKSSSKEIAEELTGLKSNTAYYVGLYAKVGEEYIYGRTTQFTTQQDKIEISLSAPTVTDITQNSARVSGKVSGDLDKVSECGICYSTSQMPTINDTKIALSNADIAYTLNGLTPGTTYYVRIYAIAGGEVHYGKQDVFATTTGVIKVHFEATSIYEDEIYMVAPGIAGVTFLNICYGTSANPKITDNVTTATKKDDGKFHLGLTNLKKGTTYYIRAYKQTGSNIEYCDDIVSAQTVGRDFSVERWGESHGEDGNGYYTSLSFKYNIKIAGTYLVESNNTAFGHFMKGDGYSTSIYIENGEGTFWYKMSHGERVGNNISFGDRYIKFTNIESQTRYYLSIQTEWGISMWY